MAKNKPRWKDLPFEDRFEKQLVRSGMSRESAAEWKKIHKERRALREEQAYATGRNKGQDKRWKIRYRNRHFAVYKMEYEPEEWTEYYTSSLPKNGVCTVTMQDDYIPESYPAKIMDATDKSKIFVKGCGVGYIASQKIIHAMQYLNWYKAAKN